MTPRTAVTLRLLPAALLMLAAAIGPLLTPASTTATTSPPFASPHASVPLGADSLGRDVLSRVVAGGRDLVLSSVLVSILVTLIAAVLGAIAALHPRIGSVIDRATDLAILMPSVLGVLVIGLSFSGAGRLPVVLTAVVFGAPFAIRIVTAAATPVAASGYVETARANGNGMLSLIFGEILPNLRTTLLALLGLRFVAAIGVVATAGFLQIGVAPPTPDWALMVRENAGGVLLNPWAVLIPSFAIATIAVSVNLACDVLAPRIRVRTVTQL